MLSLLTADNFILSIQILYILTAVGVIFVIITENRNPLKTISWILVLVFIPLLGLIIFYFFGQDGRKKRLISHKIYKKIRRRSLKGEENSAPLIIPEEYQDLANLIIKLRGTTVYNGNKVTFYNNGVNKYEALFEEIEKAQKHIHIQYYIFMDDKIGNELKKLLIRKAKEGIKVRLIYDDVGSWKAKRRFFNNMQKEGVEVQPFLKVAFRYLASRVNYRNHRKIVVIDGKVGFVGGMNVADRYVQGIGTGVWRDSHIKIEGKAVAGLQTSFIVDWYYSRKELLSSDSYFPPIETKGNNLIQYITGGPIGRFKGIHLSLIQAMFNAKESIYIQTPYFIPTDSLLMTIQTAALRGIDVRLMIPRNSDTTFVHIATKSFLKEMLDAKVKIYLFEAGFLHSKMIIIDRNLTITGSVNMDIRSFEHNFEIETFIYSETSCMEAHEIFNEDMARSSLLTAEAWNSRSWFEKLKESVVRLFSPLL